MCDDCQCFAHWLERADEVLDANGGTEVFQMTPAQVEITAGAEHIRCVRLSPKGLMRWYAGCCRTPIANSLASPRFPFVGVFHLFMDHAADGRSRDEVLGPIRARVHGRFGIGELPADAHPRAPIGIIFRSLRLLGGGWIRRAHRPTPLFDLDTGKPVSEPTVVSKEERQQLLARCGPTPAA